MPFNINTPLNNYFFYKQGPSIGTPLVGGTLEFFVVDSDVHQDTYSNIDDPNNPTVNPNPIVLGADGSTGNSTANSPVIYLQQLPYDIVCKSAEGVIQFTVSNYQGAILDPSILVDVDPRNQVDDGQFNLGIPASNPITGQLIDTAGWTITRNGSGATDTISFPPFTLGEMDVPQTPYAWLHYNCSVAATGETFKQINFFFKNVRSFESQQCTLSFYAKSAIGSGLSVSGQQFFGTGGSPSETISFPIIGPTLSTTATAYSATFTVPSCAGKTLGSNGDDGVLLVFSLPFNVVSDFYLTNVQWQLGNSATQYEYKTYEQVKSDAISTILASGEPNGFDGASQVEYYNPNTTSSESVATALSALQTEINNIHQQTWNNDALINSNFGVCQRGISFNCPTNTTTDIADRWNWFNNTSDAGSAVITQQLVASNPLPAYSNFSKYYCQIVYTAGAGGGGAAAILQHTQTGVTSYNGQVCTYSILIRNPGGSSVIVNCQVTQNFGSGGSGSTFTALGSPVTIPANSALVCSFTGTIPSVATKTIGTAGDDNVVFQTFFPVTQSFTAHVFYDQNNIGSLITPYVGRDFATELNACRPFILSSYPNGIAPGTNMTAIAPQANGLYPIYGVTGAGGTDSSASCRLQIPFPTQMVGIPSVTMHSVDGTLNNVSLYRIFNGTTFPITNLAITATLFGPSTTGTGLYQTADYSFTTGVSQSDTPYAVSAYYFADTGL